MNKYKWFDESEFECKCGCGKTAHPYFIGRLSVARDNAGIPFAITSGVRCEETDSAHSKGLAADIEAKDSRSKLLIVEHSIAVGFNRIGIYPAHVHVDEDLTKPPNVMWWGDYSARRLVEMAGSLM